jgi:hypothetical protein
VQDFSPDIGMSGFPGMDMGPPSFGGNDEVYDVLAGGEDGQIDSTMSDTDFYANLAEGINKSVLSNLAIRLLGEIQEDKDSRKEWEKKIEVGMKYLGFILKESRKTPFLNACAAYDSTMSMALIRFYSAARAELFPAAGPCKSEIVGTSNSITEDEAERVKIFMNHYLTQLDKEYYQDSELLLMYVGLLGSAFRKVYQDPTLNMPVSRTIKPQDFIVNNHTTSLMASTRITEVLYLTRKDVMIRERNGEYLDSALPLISDQEDDKSAITKTAHKIDGVNLEASENKSLFTFYECHVELSVDDIKNIDADDDEEEEQPEIEESEDGFPLEEESEEVPYDEMEGMEGEVISEPEDEEEDDFPRPYIVTICESTKKIVSIKRNWKEKDKNYKRIDYYVRYYYLPGFGIYGLGLVDLMGSNAITLTDIQRQLIDAGTLKTFPGGLKAKGMPLENNNKAIGPCEFLEINTNGMPIQDCVMLMPYGEPSAVLMQLRENLVQSTAALGSTAEAAVPESAQNAPVGTTLALIEVQNRVMSTVLRSLHASLGTELKMLFKLFGEYLPDAPYPFSVPGKDSAIMRKDFNDRFNIVPVSDPNVLTSTHRLMRAQALLNLANSAPQIHDMREAYRRMYEAMNMDNIDKILLPVPTLIPLDAMSDTMMLLAGKPIVAVAGQDHQAHIFIKTAFAQEVKQHPNPMIYPQVMMNISQHKALAYVQQLMMQSQGDQQVQMLAQMPAEQLLTIPEIQNAVSAQDAQELHMQQEQMASQAKPIDPNEVMLQDIQQRREAAQLKHEEVKLQVEESAFEAQLKFEIDKAKIEANRDIAEDKNEVTLEVSRSKQIQEKSYE